MESQIDMSQGGQIAQQGYVRPVEQELNLRRRNRPGEAIIRLLLLASGILSIFTTIGIVYVLGEESLLFFNSRAWVLAKHPVVAAEASAALVSPISADDRILQLSFDSERVPFTANQVVQIGTERMQIVERGRQTITVERGVQGTAVTAHEGNAAVFGVTDAQVKPLNELGGVIETSISPIHPVYPQDTILYLPEGAAQQFAVGNEVYLGLEDMRVTEVRPDALVVERAINNTTRMEHTATTTLTFEALAEREFTVNGQAAVASDPLLAGDELIIEGQAYRVTDVTADSVTLAGPPSTTFTLVDREALGTFIELETGYSDAFKAGEDVQFGQEVMRVVALHENGIEVERGVNDSRVRNHSSGESLLVPVPVTLGEFFTNTTWAPQIGEFGILPLLSSTLIISTIAIMVSIPLGLGSAIFLSEYADPRVRNVLKPVLEILAGVPTVVYGFFALTLVTPTLQAIIGPQVQFYNMLAAGLVVGILIVPLVSSMSEDALSAVPRSLREASYGLGATRLETTIKVVLPAAISGVLAAFIIAMSRAVGETMIVAIAAGAGPNFTFNVFEGAETMTGHIARISGGDLSYDSLDYNSIFAIGMMLFLLTLTLNVISGFISRRLREAY